MLLGNVESLRMEQRIMTAVSSVSYLPSLSQLLTPSLSLEKPQHVRTSGGKNANIGSTFTSCSDINDSDKYSFTFLRTSALMTAFTPSLVGNNGVFI